MKRELVLHLHASFEECIQTETEGGTEFWLARDLQKLFGYERWENFAKVIAGPKLPANRQVAMFSTIFLTPRKWSRLVPGHSGKSKM